MLAHCNVLFYCLFTCSFRKTINSETLCSTILLTLSSLKKDLTLKRKSIIIRFYYVTIGEWFVCSYVPIVDDV